jgi:dTDP-4-amino-4,6-dideoxygalactose transaminase
MKIPFNLPYITKNEEAYLVDALHSQRHCGNHGYGQKVLARMVEDHQYENAFLTPSCTSALEMGVLLSGIKPGDEVIVPSYTFSSTANAPVIFGAKLVFCEIDPVTLNMDVDHLAHLVKDKTKLIMPIDYAGASCEIDTIIAIAKTVGARVIQDSAQSYGALFKGKPCGLDADMACFSFHETKNFNAGEGGALLVNDPELIDRAHILQEKGTNRRDVLLGLRKKYTWVDVGSSYLLSDLLAAVLLSQLESEELITSKRRMVYETYDNVLLRFDQAGAIDRIDSANPDNTLNYHAYWITLDSASNRDRFLDHLVRSDVSAYIGYVPLHSSPFGQQLGYKAEDLPVTESIASRVVRLPLYAGLADEGLDYCAEKICESLSLIYD